MEKNIVIIIDKNTDKIVDIMRLMKGQTYTIPEGYSVDYREFKSEVVFVSKK